MYGFVPFLLDTVVKADGGGAAAKAASGGPGFGGGFGMIVIYIIALVAIMYFLSVRPTQKREKKLAEMRNSVEIGDGVVTNSGFFGKVVDITYDSMIIEFGLNKGVRIPVARTEIYGKAEPVMTKEAPPEVLAAQEAKKKKKGFFRKKED